MAYSIKWSHKELKLNTLLVFKIFITSSVFISETLGYNDISPNSTSKYSSSEKRTSNHINTNHYTDQWAVHIEGGPNRAHHIATKHGFINTGEIFPDYYHFVHRKVAKRSIEPCQEFHQRLSSEPEVRWHAQQTVKKRVKRDYLDLSERFSAPITKRRAVNKKYQLTFTDPRWPAMWYLNRGPGLDMNVQEAWSEGITGKGIVVTILDDGLEKDHPDIVRNYDPMASFDVNSMDMDPMPTYDLTDSNRHGTRCAGEVAAEANNSICAVGIAFEASVGGVRMLDGDVTDAVEARSLSHNPQHIDIYSASWGPDDDGKTVDGPGELATRAFIEGISKGRGGRGSIFVWASGNGGRDHDNCNCDGYTNSIWTLSISSATENGLVPWYSEACSSTLATTYSSGGTGEKQIVTIDLHHSCTSSHTGTSASAPLAAGICALALQANTNLTWRDMQHIVVRTARPQNLIATDWAINGVGRNVSHSFGYGLMDAGAMVKLSKKWKTVPQQNKCEIRAPYTDKAIPAKSKVTLEIKVSDCQGVNFLEHVQAKVSLTSYKRGDLLIYLISPSGTRSVLLANRRHDLNRSGFTDWPFMTVHCWGENPVGKWILEIHNEGRYTGRTILKRWSLVLYGTSQTVESLSSSSHGIEKQSTSTSTTTTLSPLSPLNNSKTRHFVAQTSERGGEIGPSSTFKDMVVKKGEIVTTTTETPVVVMSTRKPLRSRLFKNKTVSKKQKTSITSPPSSSDSQLSSVDTESSNETPFISTSTPSLFTLNNSDESHLSSTHSPTQSQTEGKLQTWAVVLHGMREDPNVGDGDKVGDNNDDKIGVTKTIDYFSPASIDFDGSENKIVVETSHVHNPNLAASSPEVADSLSPSIVSRGSCTKLSTSGLCLECSSGLYLSEGVCLSHCPQEHYGKLVESLDRKGLSFELEYGVCVPCHHSCLTCIGSTENNCTSCFSDSSQTHFNYKSNNELLSFSCLPTHIVSEIETNSYWYRGLIVIIAINLFILAFLVYFICIRESSSRGSKIWVDKGEYTRVAPDEELDITYSPSVPPHKIIIGENDD